jgi:hypothetical protein
MTDRHTLAETSDILQQVIEQARVLERDAVTAWLRSLQPNRMTVMVISVHVLSEAIERGEHRRGEGG